MIKTDSAMLRVGMRPQYLPWLRVRAVKSACAVRDIGKEPGVGREES